MAAASVGAIVLFLIVFFCVFCEWGLALLGGDTGPLEKTKKSCVPESTSCFVWLLWLFVPPLIFSVVLTAVTYIYYWRPHEPDVIDKYVEMLNLAQQEADRLAAIVDENGLLVQHPAPTLDVDDAWGNPLRVRYEEDALDQIIRIESSGPDGVPGNDDDFRCGHATVPRPKKDIALDMLGKAKDAIKERLSPSKAENEELEEENR